MKSSDEYNYLLLNKNKIIQFSRYFLVNLIKKIYFVLSLYKLYIFKRIKTGRYLFFNYCIFLNDKNYTYKKKRKCCLSMPNCICRNLVCIYVVKLK